MVVRVQHHLLIGELSQGEIAELFDVDRSNLRRLIKSKGLREKPFPSSYSRKDRHIGLQLIKEGVEWDGFPLTPRSCPVCGVRLTYNIYGDEVNNATVKLIGDGAYEVICRECNNDNVHGRNGAES